MQQDFGIEERSAVERQADSFGGVFVVDNFVVGYSQAEKSDLPVGRYQFYHYFPINSQTYFVFQFITIRRFTTTITLFAPIPQSLAF